VAKNDLRSVPPTTSIADWPDAEVLLLTAFRCWLSGYETCDIACWEVGWQGVSRHTSVVHAKRIIAELSQFTRIFRQALVQRFVYLPHCCSRITTDEYLVLQMVACAQHGELTRAGQLAHKLSNNTDYFELVGAASDLGASLKDASLTLQYACKSETPSSNRLH